jgi:hypothetical protein
MARRCGGDESPTRPCGTREFPWRWAVPVFLHANRSMAGTKCFSPHHRDNQSHANPHPAFESIGPDPARGPFQGRHDAAGQIYADAPAPGQVIEGDLPPRRADEAGERFRCSRLPIICRFWGLRHAHPRARSRRTLSFGHLEPLTRRPGARRPRLRKVKQGLLYFHLAARP